MAIALTYKNIQDEKKQRKIEYDRKWRERNRDKTRASALAWYYRNREEQIKRSTAYQKALPPEVRKARNKKYYWRAPEKRRALAKEVSRKIRELLLDHYGNGDPACICCGERERSFLALDHINNDGSEHKRQIAEERGLHKVNTAQVYSWLIANNFPPIVQILCHNCNMGKALNGGICPHKSKEVLNADLP